MQLREYIKRIELESYNSVAKRLGISIDYFTKRNIELINSELITQPWRNYRNYPLKSEEDYWNCVHESYEMGKTVASQLICDYLKKYDEGFDLDSIIVMSRALGFDEKEMDFSISFFKSFMEKIPVVVLFDLNFNAEADCGFLFENVPVVRAFDFLSHNLYFLLKHLCYFAFEGDKNGFQYRSGFTNLTSEYFRFVVDQIDSLLLMSTGKIAMFEYKIKGVKQPVESIEIISYAMNEVANSFVWIHELGHILFGDVMRKKWEKNMEFRCDRFSSECLFNAQKYIAIPNSRGRPLVLIGIDSLFLILKAIGPLTQTGNVDRNVYSQINERGKRINENLLSRLTKAEKRIYHYFTNLLMPLISTNE